MRILVTGAAGFIGSHVSRLLMAEGHDVTGLDNLNDAYDVRLKEWRLGELQAIKGFGFVLSDTTDFETLSERWARRGPFDAVVDLAARAGVRQSLVDPWAYLSTNAKGSLNTLELCRRHGTQKYVLASSSSVYGHSATLPYSEDQKTDAPVSPYAASKLAAEALAHSYYHAYGLDITTLRFFTVYGPAGRPDMSPYRFIRWIAEGDPVLVYGDGTQTRDYTFVEDIARGVHAALGLSGYHVINLGSDSPVSLVNMARCIEAIVGREARFVFKEGHKADVAATWADVRRAKALLGWSPKSSLREGLLTTVNWYRANRRFAAGIRLD